MISPLIFQGAMVLEGRVNVTVICVCNARISITVKIKMICMILGDKRGFGDLDEEEDDVFNSKKVHIFH